MKQSEILKKKLEALDAEYEARVQSDVYNRPDHTCETHDRLWREFWHSYGCQSWREREELGFRILAEQNREIEVGDGVTLHLWSDRHACTVIAKTKTTITIRRDKAIRNPDFRPVYEGLCCINQDEQEYTYEPDPNGEVIRCRWSEKRGRYQTGSDGSMGISRGRHEYYDYNF